jgi:hypothetical protein
VATPMLASSQWRSVWEGVGSVSFGVPTQTPVTWAVSVLYGSYENINRRRGSTSSFPRPSSG